MKALTLWQPWASLVAIGAKSIESRSWGTGHRGVIAIHATRRCSHPTGIQERIQEARVRLVAGGRTELLPPQLPFGAVVAVANLFNCLEAYVPGDPVERVFGDYGPNRFAWLLKGIVPLEEPIPWNGAQGLWTVPPDLFGLIHGQVFAESPEFRLAAINLTTSDSPSQGRLF